MTRVQMLKGIGFNQAVTKKAVEALGSKTTKAAAAVVEKIETSQHYIILANGEQFTILAQWRVSKQEAKQLEQVLKMEYVEDGAVITQNGLWLDWVELLEVGEVGNEADEVAAAAQEQNNEVAAVEVVEEIAAAQEQKGSSIKTLRFGVNYKAGKGQTVEAVINEGQTIVEVATGLEFDAALKLCSHLDNGGIGREQRYKTNGKGGGFMYIGTEGTIKRYHGGQPLFVSDTGVEEIIPTYGLDKI